MSQQAFKVLKANFTSLTNTASILVIGSVEVVVGKNIFQCPCNADDIAALRDPHDPSLTPSPGRLRYALAFILWPAVAAFFMAVAMSGTILRCLIERRDLNHHYFRACVFLVRNASTVLVPPLAWFFIVLMDGRYFLCAATKFPDTCLPDVKTLNATMAANHAILERENQWHRSTSQMIALDMLAAIAALVGILVLCGHMFSHASYYHGRYIKSYREKEMETFEAVSEVSLTRDLTAKWEEFFKKSSHDDWGKVSDLPAGPPREVNGKYYYSAFHEWQPDATEIESNNSIPPHEADTAV